jgi:DNA-binding MarR family transcriptional regulator
VTNVQTQHDEIDHPNPQPFPPPADDYDGRFQAIRNMIQGLAGDTDTTGLELMRLVHMVANAYESAVDGQLRSAELSGPRWGLLLRLLAEERFGCLNGVSPTRLSHHQNVSKNTISALLRGLEEQGLIERTLDLADRRVFQIRLTDMGRQIVQDSTPGHIAFLNALAADLTAEERTQLTELLEKLHRSLVTRKTEAAG